MHHPVCVISVFSADECRGCRRIQHGDQKHTFEILFAHGPPLELAASDAFDERSWILAICNAVTYPSGVSDCL